MDEVRIAGCKISKPSEYRLVPSIDGNLTSEGLRDVILRMGDYIFFNDRCEPKEVLLLRAQALWEAAIQSDAIMSGFLGRGGPESGRNLLGGSGSLEQVIETPESAAKNKTLIETTV